MAIAPGVGAGPVIDQPPPLMYSLPPTAAAWSASIIVIFSTAFLLVCVCPTPVPYRW
jgi:hypothetical protein